MSICSRASRKKGFCTGKAILFCTALFSAALNTYSEKPVPTDGIIDETDGPDVYYLSANRTVPVDIRITGVTLKLRGYKISGSGTGNGVIVGSLDAEEPVMNTYIYGPGTIENFTSGIKTRPNVVDFNLNDATKSSTSFIVLQNNVNGCETNSSFDVEIYYVNAKYNRSNGYYFNGVYNCYIKNSKAHNNYTGFYVTNAGHVKFESVQSYSNSATGISLNYGGALDGLNNSDIYSNGVCGLKMKSWGNQDHFGPWYINNSKFRSNPVGVNMDGSYSHTFYNCILQNNSQYDLIDPYYLRSNTPDVNKNTYHTNCIIGKRKP